jgi:uncharacterized protein
MNTYSLLILVAIGLIIGALGGMMGIGGALILIPSLVYFLGFDQHEAIGTSLAVMLPPIGLFAAYNYYKAGQVNLKYALILAVAFMVGSYFTSKIALKIPENLMKKVFSVFLIFIAIKMFFSK